MAQIVQITDIHLVGDAGPLLLEHDTRAAFFRIKDYLSQHHADCERLIVTGDLAHDEGEQVYQELFDALAPWHDRLRVIPGNHDARLPMQKVFAPIIRDDRESVSFLDELNGWTLIGLDTLIEGAVEGDLAGEQWTWLRETVSAATRPVAIFMHHPPVFVGSRWVDELSLNSLGVFSNLVEEFEQIKLVVCGHVHQEFSTQIFHADVFTTPSTCVQFKPHSVDFAVDSSAPGFRILNLSSDGTFETEVVRL
ncbi:MAG: phosphodiesterase [Planctomycetota bacterium]|nr:phosphodiesterase [Planctomycetota bacterium]